MCCLGLLLYCRELLGTVLDSVAEETRLGDESVEEAHFVDIAPLNKAEPLMVLLDHTCGHRLPEGLRCDFFPPVGRGQLLSAVPASTSGWYYPRAFNALAWCARRIALACSAEAAWPAALQALAARAAVAYRLWTGDEDNSSQVAAFCRHKCTATALSTWGNVDVPRSRPAIEGSEDGGGRRAASGRKKGPSTTSSAPRALPGRKEPGQGVVASHGPCRGANHLTARARD